MSQDNNETTQKIKCIVWDLDHTIWDGVLLEDENVTLKPGILDIIKKLDDRGILQSIASKNEYNSAMEKLKIFGIQDYFLYPQIHWNSKAYSIEQIQKLINIGIDTLAFVDDQPFEREEVTHSHPEVLCIDAADIDKILDMDEMNPRFITGESAIRRQLYMSDIKRQDIENEFVGPQEDFLASLGMVLNISPAIEEDLKRAEELTMRTHQLNTTGYTYSYDELDVIRKSDEHILLVASLDDKYGTYGKIGLVLIQNVDNIWNIKLLLMSCRVMSRGVGSIMINFIRKEAQKRNVKLQAEMISTDKNRMMYMTYKFAGFYELEQNDHFTLFENNLSNVPDYPDYVKLNISEFGR
ncbi:haloacid dehalogenase [Candidatus Magnetomorum sp. HK-1]|nr:haloacid dehalogenase [Candidatus Magnetomorum sp. HK-1]